MHKTMRTAFFIFLGLMSIKALCQDLFPTGKAEYQGAYSTNECKFFYGHFTEDLFTNKDAKRSLAQRLDLAIQMLPEGQVLPRNFFEQYLKENHYKPKEPCWFGRCDAAAASSLDPAIQKVLKEITNDISYHLRDETIILTKENMRDLFSDFYPNSEKVEFIGGRAQGMFDSGIPPLQFHEKIYRSLKDGKGIVANISKSPGEIHNRPIKSINSVYSKKIKNKMKTFHVALELEYFDEVSFGQPGDNVQKLFFSYVVVVDSQGRINATWESGPQDGFFLWVPKSPPNLSEDELRKNIEIIKSSKHVPNNHLYTVATSLIFKLISLQNIK